MNKNLNSKKACIHLYNQKEEGIGEYDVHYINAYKKVKGSEKVKERYAA